MTQARNLRRVKRTEITFIERRADGLDICLDCWARSMSMGRDDKDLGVQRLKMLCGDGDGYGNEDTSQQRRDNDIAQATNAMIDSLSRLHWWAIRRKMGLTTAWNFPNQDYMNVAIEACAELDKKLRRNETTAVLFL